MTDLRKRMLEELQRRNYSPTTIRYYLRVVENFAHHFGKRPDRLTQENIREYQVYLLQERKLEASTVGLHIAALRFFFVKTLRRPYLRLDLPSPKRPKRLPTILSQDEVARLIDSANNLLDYAMLMTLYATGVRRAELSRLKVEDIDSERMIVHIRQGKGNRDRDVPLTPKLLETLREYWRWMKPKTYLFPWHGEQLACRCPHLHEGAVGSLPGSRPEGRHHQTRLAAHLEALCRFPDYAACWCASPDLCAFEAWRRGIVWTPCLALWESDKPTLHLLKNY